MQTVKLRDPEYRHIEILIRRVNPKYRKHRAIVSWSRQYTDHGGYWDGGSRSIAYLVTPRGIRPVGGPTAPPQFGGGSPVTVPLHKGDAVVILGTFRGKTATARVVLPEIE